MKLESNSNNGNRNSMVLTHKQDMIVPVTVLLLLVFCNLTLHLKRNRIKKKNPLSF